MRAKISLLLLCLAMTARAREWKSEIFHCAANIPESNGWQMIEPPRSPGIEPVLTMQQVARQAVFGISVVEDYKGAKVADPAVQRGLEAMLRKFGYAFVGHSTVRAGGIDWLQYPVRAGAGAQQVSGIIRYASAGGYVFGITMLRGGGQEAAQDAELQQAAASFRILPASAFAAVPAAGKGTPTAPAAGGKPEVETDDSADESRKRMIWYAGGGVLVLLVLFSIIGGSAKKR